MACLVVSHCLYMCFMSQFWFAFHVDSKRRFARLPGGKGYHNGQRTGTNTPSVPTGLVARTGQNQTERGRRIGALRTGKAFAVGTNLVHTDRRSLPTPSDETWAMAQQQRSPRITRLSWGRLETEGEQSFKDAKLFPGGAREWNWRETGTAHVPGIQPADVEELIERGARVVVLSRGIYERLQVRPETLRLLRERGIRSHVLQTDEAVRLYNELAETEPVGGLFHSTC